MAFDSDTQGNVKYDLYVIISKPPLSFPLNDVWKVNPVKQISSEELTHRLGLARNGLCHLGCLSIGWTFNSLQKHFHEN